MKKVLFFTLMLFLIKGLLVAQTFDWSSSDNASTTNYPDGNWPDASNGGYGFSSWSFTTNGTAGRYIGGTAQGNPSFGLYSSGTGAYSTAKRSFDKVLKAGDTFTVKIAHTSTINGEIGLTLLAGSTGKITLKFIGGGSSWLLNDGGSDFGIGQNYSANTSITFSFTYNGENSYSFSFGNASGNNYTASAEISGINGVNFFNTNQGSGENFGFNDLTLTGSASSSSDVPTNANIVINGNVNLAADESLTVNDLTVDGSNTLTIKSTSSGTGSLIVNGTATGNVTIERYIAAASWSSGNDGFHLISSPVAAEEISGEWTPTGSGNDYDFYGWSEANQTWVNKKNNDPEDPPTWAVFHPSTNFNIDQGYLVAYQTAATKTFSGTLNNGNKQVTLTQSGTPAVNNSYGYNLIGNPFSSALDWTNDSWDTENNNYGGVAKIWSGGAYIDVVTADPVDDDVTVIPAMNGFFVFTSADDNLFTIPSAAQVHSANNWHKSVNSNHAIKLTVRGVNSSLIQGSSLRFNTEATNGFDLAFDSYFMAGYAPMFYSVTEGKNYSTNTLPGYDSETTIPFVFVKNEYTEFELELTNSIEGQPIFLTDNKTGTIHNLSENPVYTFTASEGDNPDRFTLHFGVTGLSDNTALATLRAYVSHGQLTILGETGELNVDILDMQGRVLERRAVQMDGSYSQPLNLPAGVYVVRVYNGQAAKSVKVILTNR